MKKIIITNNVDLKPVYPGCEICCQSKSFMEVLYWARDMVHQGHRLLSHPLCGSLKPNETPYKSVLLSADRQPGVDAFSLSVMEYSIQKAAGFPLKERSLSELVLRDFRFIDKCLMESALNSDV